MSNPQPRTSTLWSAGTPRLSGLAPTRRVRAAAALASALTTAVLLCSVVLGLTSAAAPPAVALTRNAQAGAG
jgi:hypothetical protein